MEITTRHITAMAVVDCGTSNSIPMSVMMLVVYMTMHVCILSKEHCSSLPVVVVDTEKIMRKDDEEKQ